MNVNGNVTMNWTSLFKKNAIEEVISYIKFHEYRETYFSIF